MISTQSVFAYGKGINFDIAPSSTLLVFGVALQPNPQQGTHPTLV